MMKLSNRSIFFLNISHGNLTKCLPSCIHRTTHSELRQIILRGNLRQKWQLLLFCENEGCMSYLSERPLQMNRKKKYIAAPCNNVI